MDHNYREQETCLECAHGYISYATAFVESQNDNPKILKCPHHHEGVSGFCICDLFERKDNGCN